MNKRTIKITTTRTYTRTAVVEIKCPEDLPLDNVADYLYTNPGLFQDSLEQAVNNAELDCDRDFDEVRFDVIESVKLNVWGGTL